MEDLNNKTYINDKDDNQINGGEENDNYYLLSNQYSKVSQYPDKSNPNINLSKKDSSLCQNKININEEDINKKNSLPIQGNKSNNLQNEDEESSNYFLINDNIKKNKEENIPQSMPSPKENEDEIQYDDEQMDVDYNNIEEDYDVNDNEDSDEDETNDILENMFLGAEEQENPMDIYLDIIKLDENKERKWAYKSYEKICLIYLEFDNYLLFGDFFPLLLKTAETFSDSKVSIYVKNTTSLFIQEIMKHSTESIFHWLEDITSKFKMNQDKIKNIFEASFNLYYTLFQKIMCEKKKQDEEQKEEEEIFDCEEIYNKNKLVEFDSRFKEMNINILDYVQEKQKLESLAIKYLIEECGCYPKSLDKRGNNYFYYSPSHAKRGGEKYLAPIGWLGFGIEVLERYGADTDWIANDNRPGEWAVAYHGFGGKNPGESLKKIIKTFVLENLRPGGGQAFSHAEDRRHPKNKCGNGVYLTPNINVALSYSGVIPLDNKYYNIIIMARVNPRFIREPTNQPDYWILDGKSNQLRPYRLLFKESNYRNNFHH